MNNTHIFTAFLIAVALIVPFALAQDADSAVDAGMVISEPAILPPDYEYPGTGILQNQQYYRVIFDDEGEATVITKIIVGNAGRDPLTSITLNLPGTVRLISAVQEYQPIIRECMRYVSECTDGDCREVCAQWYEHPQWPPTYYPLNIEQTQGPDGLDLTINLSQTVKSGESATVLIAYKSEDYTSQSLGVWNFDFETVRQTVDISNVRVAITVAEDLYLKESDSGIEYKADTFDRLAAETSARPAGVQSQTLSDYSQSLHYAPGLVKTAQALDPLETFRVEGSYSSSYTALHLVKIATWTAVVIALITGLIIGSVTLARRVRAKKHANESWTAVLAGILNSAALVAVFLLGWFALNYLNQGYYYGGIYAALGILVMIVWIVIMLAIFLAPPIFIGITYGPMYAVMTAGVTLGILFIISLIGVVILAALGSGTVPPVPIYY